MDESQPAQDLPAWRPKLWCAGMAVLFCASGGGLLLFLSHDRSVALQSAKREMEISLSLASAKPRNALHDTDAMLANEARYLARVQERGQDLQDSATAVDIRNNLIQQKSAIPAVISASIFDARGQWVISTRFAKLPTTVYNPKRPLWHAALETPASRSFLLPPEVSPLLDIPNIVLGRSVRSRDGKILGMVVAFVSIDVLDQSFTSFTAGNKTVIFTKRDGSTLFSLNSQAPRIPGWMAASWRDALQRGGGCFEARDDKGAVWLGSISVIDTPHLAITTLLPRATVLQTWWRTAKLVISAAVIGMCLAAMFFAFWLRQRRKTVLRAREVIEAHYSLLHSLSHDPATGFYNRAGFEKALNRRITQERPLVLHLLGIHRFQAIVDIVGHIAAEALLSEVANRIRKVLGPGDIAGALAGEDFCIAQFDGDADALAEAMLEALALPYLFQDREISLDFSIGIVRTAHSLDWSLLLRDGATAMHRSQGQALNAFAWFEQDADRLWQDRLLLEHDLRAALGTGQLFMVYQPIQSLGSGEICGFEALMRWHHPQRGFIPPSIFIPVAERSGLLLPVDRMVKRSPMDAAALWPEPISISINCSAIEFRDPTLPARLQRRLDETGVSADRCVIEVTESALLENDREVLKVMHEIRKIGARLALDDFGTAHASLSYLQHFPFTRIKIDQSFIRTMDQPAAAAILDASLALSAKLGLEVVAEGVETMEQLGRLQRLGCDLVQGYLIARPMAEADILPFLAAWEPFKAPLSGNRPHTTP